VRKFLPFVRKMAGILKAHQVNALNVSIRHSPADSTSLLAWAPQEVRLRLYYKQRSTKAASAEVRGWTRS